MRLVAIAVVLGGCYGPSYTDCAIGCPDNKCPDNLECDPGLGVCRLEGMMGTSCPAPMDDANSGSDANPDGNTTTCGMVPGSLFCADFDTSTEVAVGWTNSVIAYANSSVTRVPAAGSFAMQSFTPTHPMVTSGTVEARLARTALLAPGGTQTVKLNVRLDITQRDDNGAGPVGILVFKAGPALIDFVSNNSTSIAINFSADGNTPSEVGTVAFPPNTWHAFELRWVNDGNGGFIAHAFVDGQPLGNNNGVVGAATLPTSSTYEVYIGLAGQLANTETTVLYDDVIVTASPPQ